MVSLALILLVSQADELLVHFFQSLYYQNTNIQEVPVFVLADPVRLEAIKAIAGPYTTRLNIQWIGSLTDPLWTPDNLDSILEHSLATHFLVTSDQFFVSRDWVNTFQIRIEGQTQTKEIQVGKTEFLPDNQFSMLSQAILYSHLWFPQKDKPDDKADPSRDFLSFYLLNACLPRSAIQLMSLMKWPLLEGRALDVYLAYQLWVQGYRFHILSAAFIYYQQKLYWNDIVLRFESEAQGFKRLLPDYPFLVQKMLNLNHVQFLEPEFMRQWCIELEPSLSLLESDLHSKSQQAISILSFEQESSVVFQKYVFDLLRYQKYIYFQVLIPECESQDGFASIKGLYPRQQASIWEQRETQLNFQERLLTLTAQSQACLYEKLDILMAILTPEDHQSGLEINFTSPAIGSYLQDVFVNLELTNAAYTNELEFKHLLNSYLQSQSSQFDWILIDLGPNAFQNLSLFYAIESLLKPNGYVFLSSLSHPTLNELTNMILSHYPFLICSEYQGHYCKCLVKLTQTLTNGQDNV